jgi:hypothetical protein
MKCAAYDFVLVWDGVDLTKNEAQTLLLLRVRHTLEETPHLCTEAEVASSLSGYGKGAVVVTRLVAGREVTFSIAPAP